MKALKVLYRTLGLIIFLTTIISAKESRFTFGLQGGIFAPQNRYSEPTIKSPYSPRLDSWNGFGNTFEIAGFLGYYLSAFELRFEAGTRNTATRKEYTFYSYSRDRIQVLVFDFNILYHIRMRAKNIEPYVGLGVGINKASWIQEGGEIVGIFWKNNDISYPVGVNFIAGFEMPINPKFYFNGELKHYHIYKSWPIKNDAWSDIAYQDRNKNGLGGTSMKFGLGYRF